MRELKTIMEKYETWENMIMKRSTITERDYVVERILCKIYAGERTFSDHRMQTSVTADTPTAREDLDINAEAPTMEEAKASIKERNNSATATEVGGVAAEMLKAEGTPSLPRFTETFWKLEIHQKHGRLD